MTEINDIYKKASTAAIANHLLYGRQSPELQKESYEERNNIAIDKFLKASRDPDADMDELANELAADLSELYMEIGIKAGVRLALDMFTLDRTYTME